MLDRAKKMAVCKRISAQNPYTETLVGMSLPVVRHDFVIFEEIRR